MTTYAEVNPAWLKARGRAGEVLDRFMISLRNSRNLVGTVQSDGGESPYMQCINDLADLMEPVKLAKDVAQSEVAKLRAVYVALTKYLVPEGMTLLEIEDAYRRATDAPDDEAKAEVLALISAMKAVAS